jgi:hypothetical protein
MFWRRQRPRSQRRQRHDASTADYPATAGRHRLADGDVVPVAGHRRYADILAEQATAELPQVGISMTPGQEHRSGVWRWLR